MDMGLAGNTKIFVRYPFHSIDESVWLSQLTKGITMGKRVFVNYYFRVNFGQGAKASKYFEEIKAEALKLGISDVHYGTVEIGTNALSTCITLTFESADAFGRQWGGGSEYQVKSADWKALFKRMSEEPSQVYERVGADLIYEQ
jgi:hypothetical protein